MPAGAESGCTQVNRNQLRGSILRPPFAPYFDAGTGSIKFRPGVIRRFKRNDILQRIQDEAIADNILNEVIN
jgi:hypothetical protein